jgi:hypothetical protein
MLVSPSDEEALEDGFERKLLSVGRTVEKESRFAERITNHASAPVQHRCMDMLCRTTVDFQRYRCS